MPLKTPKSAASVKAAPKPSARQKLAPPNTGKPVGAVLNAVKILRYLSRQPEPTGVTQIARELQINSSTCFNILRTLTGEDFTSFDAERKLYGMGAAFNDMARGATMLGSDADDLRSMIERIAREQDVTVTLWRRIAADRIMLIMAALANGNTRIHMSVGERLPLLIGSAGRVMAGHLALKPAELRRQFKQVRWDQPPAFEAFMQEVAQAKQRGWSTDNGNYLTGIASVAIPVFNSAGEFTMACTATMFVNQFSDARAQSLAAELGVLNQWARPSA